MTGSPAPRYSLASLAERFGLSVAAGDAATIIAGVCALSPGQARRITFADRPGQAAAIAETGAAAVVAPAELSRYCRVACLASEQPRLDFARLARLFERPPPPQGIQASAVIAPSARIAPTAAIGAHCVIGANTTIAEGAVLGPGCVVGPDVSIDRDTVLASNISIGADTRIGARVHIEAHAAIGGRGFGLVHDGRAWQPVPQLAGVSVADDVEIGAGVTVDRGALDDTVIEAGVKIDDQVHIGHNCVIGAHTVIAGCTGIAGSCRIGNNCMIGGGVGIGDHVTIAERAVITAASQVPRDIQSPGVYSSTFRAMPARIWRKRLALFRQLDRIERRLRAVERKKQKDTE